VPVPYVVLAAIGIAALAVFPTMVAAVLNHFTSRAMAAKFNPSPRVYGPDAPPIALLAFLDWTPPEQVAWLLMSVAEDEAGCILLLLRKRHVNQIIACLPPPRQEAVVYWMEHPQPFTRQRQAYLARRFKRELQRATA
jgi:hypothetical protein